MSKRMQNLIMQILQAQPSLRDSKTFLNSFAPRRPPPPLTKPKTASEHHEFPLPHNVQHPGSLHNPSTTTWDPEKTIALDAEKNGNVSNLPQSILAKLKEQQFPPVDKLKENSTVAIPATTSTSDSLADSHTALVKVQGPFTDRQLDSIAEGLVYLKKLGLVSVCVIDHDDWPEFAAEIDKHGRYVVQSDELEQQRMQKWLSSAKDKGKDKADRFGSSSIGRKQERLRKRIMAETLRLADALNRKGAMARPFPQAVVRIDAPAAAKVEKEHRSFTEEEVSSTNDIVAGSSKHSPTIHHGSAGEARLRPPLVSDDSLASIRAALASNQIPVLSPYALFENEAEGTLETLCIRADDMMVALTRDMVVAAHKADTERSSLQQVTLPYPVGGEVDMMPLRLMVINREGGIPSHARGGDPHLSINLASEYHQVVNSFIWSRTHPTALRNLDAIADCLSYMPQTSSGVLVTHRSPRSLIGNLITNKAAHSPSLPHRLLANKKDVRHTPTIVRPGLPIKVIADFEKVDLEKLTELMQASFRRKLDKDGYFARLRAKMDFVIVTGDYLGAAIVTKEWAPGEDQGKVEPIAYLDKFAVLPSLQGSGTVDFLWGALRDEVQGLGLLDALNDNGGKGGYGQGRDLVWKSRSNNPVNRWYYERSNGFVRIDTAPQTMVDTQRTPAWQLFWCDAEDKLARLSGERRVTASPTHLEQAADEAAEDNFVEERRVRDTTAYEKARRMSKPRLQSGLIKSEVTEGKDDHLLTLLPIVAPEEGGRLERWARCMGTIPTAWAD